MERVWVFGWWYLPSKRFCFASVRQLEYRQAPLLSLELCVFLETAVATHSSTLAWKIPWMEEPGRLQSMESLGVRTKRLHFHFSLSCIGEGNGNPLQCSCLENPTPTQGWGDPSGLPSLGAHRVGHDWSNSAAAKLYFSRPLSTALNWHLWY